MTIQDSPTITAGIPKNLPYRSTSASTASCSSLSSSQKGFNLISTDSFLMAFFYVPLHPQVVEAIQPLLNGKKDDEAVFQHGSFWMWVKRQKIPLSQIEAHFVLGDLRKFTEQHGDILEWEQSNRAYILTHGVSGIEWGHYCHPLPDSVRCLYKILGRRVF